MCMLTKHITSSKLTVRAPLHGVKNLLFFFAFVFIHNYFLPFFYEHFHLRLRDYKKEVFYVALLDQKNSLIGEERVSEGSLTDTMVHPREVFSCAVAQRAAAVAVVHNHPSGDPTPSGNDKAITKRLNSVAEMLGIRLLDHVIIGDGRYVSFVESGLLV